MQFSSSSRVLSSAGSASLFFLALASGNVARLVVSSVHNAGILDGQLSGQVRGLQSESGKVFTGQQLMTNQSTNGEMRLGQAEIAAT